MATPNNPQTDHVRNISGDLKTSRAACINCHNRKIRCDANRRGFPCSNCITSQRSNCRIHEKKKRGLVRPAHNPIPILRRPGSQSVFSQAPSAGQSIQLPVTNQVVESSGSAHWAGSGPPVPNAAVDDGLQRHLVEFIDRKDMQDSVQRGVRITYVGRDVSNINFLVRQRDGGDNETIHHLPSEEIASQYTAHTKPERIPREAFILPDQSLADELVDAYFTYVNPWYPIIEEDVFMAQYKARDPVDPPSLLVLQSVLLVGAHVTQNKENRDVLKATCFRRAKMLFDARLEKNRDIVVQAALLLTWHSDGTEDIGANAWYWVGIAARTATGLGMHRDAGEGHLVHHDMRTWRRIWWILVQFDVTISLYYGRPQAINLDECDVQPMTYSDFIECGSGCQKEYVVKRTELCVLISKVLRERFGLKVSQEDRRRALSNADEALADWCTNLPTSLQMRSSEMTTWASSLHLTYNNFLVLLHRPHPRASRSDDQGPNDSDICSAAANTIASIFEDLRAKDRIKYLWVSDINALFTAMLQVSVELRLSNPVLALNALRRFDSSLLSLRNLAEYWINAESILRLFEESSEVQHGIRLGESIKDSRHAQSADASTGHQAGNGAMRSEGGVFQQESQESEFKLMPESNSNIDMLAAAVYIPPDPGHQTVHDNEIGSWGDLMSQNELVQDDFFMSNIASVESEWREIYWQEPGLQESFGDGMWGWL